MYSKKLAKWRTPYFGEANRQSILYEVDMPASPTDLLMPNGKLIGTPGSNPSIRQIPGGNEVAEAFFEDLTAGEQMVIASTYPGKLVDLSGGGRVGLRLESKSGEPTIDVDIPGISIKKLKFV